MDNTAECALGDTAVGPGSTATSLPLPEVRPIYLMDFDIFGDALPKVLVLYLRLDRFYRPMGHVGT